MAGTCSLALFSEGGSLFRSACFSMLIAAITGVLAGLAAGYYGWWVDSLIMRIVDAVLAFPGLLLAIFLVGILGPSLRNAMLAIAVTSIPAFGPSRKS